MPELAGCIAFAEPGLIASRGQLYLINFCILGTNEPPIVLTRLDHGTSVWSYGGTLLTNADGTAITVNITGFNAADLFVVGGSGRLVVTPTSGDGSVGCIIYEVDLDAESRRV